MKKILLLMLAMTVCALTGAAQVTLEDGLAQALAPCQYYRADIAYIDDAEGIEYGSFDVARATWLVQQKVQITDDQFSCVAHFMAEQYPGAREILRSFVKVGGKNVDTRDGKGITPFGLVLGRMIDTPYKLSLLEMLYRLGSRDLDPKFAYSNGPMTVLHVVFFARQGDYWVDQLQAWIDRGVKDTPDYYGKTTLDYVEAKIESISKGLHIGASYFDVQRWKRPYKKAREILRESHRTQQQQQQEAVTKALSRSLGHL